MKWSFQKSLFHDISRDKFWIIVDSGGGGGDEGGVSHRVPTFFIPSNSLIFP